MKAIFGSVVIAASIAAAAAACFTEPTTLYGDPSGLSRLKLGEAGAGTLECDGGTIEPLADGGCAVSWAEDLFPLVTQNVDGGWHCADNGCHTGAQPQTPAIDPSSPGAARASLAGYKAAGKPYIDQSKDPASSTMPCNLKGTCGTRRMPVTPPGSAATCGQLAKLEGWLRCGAPDN